MSVNKNTLRDFLLMWGIIFAGIIYVYQMKKNPVVRPRLERIEAFKNKPATKPAVDSVILETNGLQPDDANLKPPRQPYSLLKDEFPQATVRTSPTSQRCYESDFERRIEKTGTFRQLTNNYKREQPDSCSSPLHEFVLSFYKPKPI